MHITHGTYGIYKTCVLCRRHSAQDSYCHRGVSFLEWNEVQSPRQTVPVTATVVCACVSVMQACVADLCPLVCLTGQIAAQGLLPGQTGQGPSGPSSSQSALRGSLGRGEQAEKHVSGLRPGAPSAGTFGAQTHVLRWLMCSAAIFYCKAAPAADMHPTPPLATPIKPESTETPNPQLKTPHCLQMCKVMLLQLTTMLQADTSPCTLCAAHQRQADSKSLQGWWRCSCRSHFAEHDKLCAVQLPGLVHNGRQLLAGM